MKRTKKATPKKHTTPRAPQHTRKTSPAKPTRNHAAVKHTRKPHRPMTAKAALNYITKSRSPKARANRALQARVDAITKRALASATSKRAQAACPHTETLVIEVRRPKFTRRGNAGQVRRRLECVQCKHRYTTYSSDTTNRRPRRGAGSLPFRP